MKYRVTVRMEWNGSSDEGDEVFLLNEGVSDCEVSQQDMDEALAKWLKDEREREPRLGAVLDVEWKRVTSEEEEESP